MMLSDSLFFESFLYSVMKIYAPYLDCLWNYFLGGDTKLRFILLTNFEWGDLGFWIYSVLMDDATEDMKEFCFYVFITC